MATKYTNGPWSVEMEDGRTYVTGGASKLAIVLWPNSGLPQKNARMMSAAPNMLSALRMAEAFVAKFEEDDDYTDGQVETLNAIRAAIFRAEGD